MCKVKGSTGYATPNCGVRITGGGGGGKARCIATGVAETVLLLAKASGLATKAGLALATGSTGLSLSSGTFNPFGRTAAMCE